MGRLELPGKSVVVEAFEPTLAENTNCAPTSAFLSAYQLIDSDPKSAAEHFEKLAADYPLDHLVTFYHNDGLGRARGTLVEGTK